MNLNILISLTLLNSVAMPTFASANGLQYSGGRWNEQSSLVLKVQEWEKERGGSWIPSYGSELFREPELLRESRETEMRSKSDSHGPSLGPSVDMPGSVDGHTGGVDRPFFGGRPSGGDPSVEDLSRMDGGGFSSPGSSWGSVPGYHGR